MLILTQFTPRFLAVEIESTGLDPTSREIISIGAELLDGRLQPGRNFQALIRPLQPLVEGENADGKALEMHLQSGLLASVEASGRVPGIVFFDFLAWLADASQGQRVTLIAQNAPFVRGFLEHHVRGIRGLLNFRDTDLASVQAFVGVVKNTPAYKLRSPEKNLLADIETLRSGIART